MDFTAVAFWLVQALHRQQLTCFDINLLAEFLEHPLSVGRSHLQPLIQLMGGIIQVESQHKPIPRNQSTWLAIQLAYLEGLETLIHQEERLRKPWLNRSWIRQFSPFSTAEKVDIPWVTELETIRRKRLTDLEAEKILSNLGQAAMIQHLYQALQGWLLANGCEERESQLLVQRLNQGSFGQLLKAIARYHISLPQLQKFVRIGDSIHGAEPSDYELLETPPSGGGLVDLDREFYRSYLHITLSYPCFEESFAWSQLYVIPKGLPAYASESEKKISLLDWANEQLSDSYSLALIEGPSGLGKTRFCQWWAAEISQKVYPQWMPIVISLAAVKLGNSLEETLDSAFPLAKFTSREGWLKPGLPPCLLILDSWESIPYSCVGDDPYQKLLEQIARFQQEHRDPRGWPRHKIVLTSRADWRSRFLLEGTQGKLSPLAPTRFPLKIARFQLEPMNLDTLQEWFKNWSKLQSREVAKSYFDFLKQAGLFSGKTTAKELAALVRQPLMLYFLGVLHRDGCLEKELIEMPFPGVKLEIYERVITWLLGETSLGTLGSTEKLIRFGFGHAGRSREVIASFLQGRSAANVRLLSQKVALILLQSGQESLSEIHLRQELDGDFTEGLNLPNFLFQSVVNTVKIIPKLSPSVTSYYAFSHRSLGEYLAAEAIASMLKPLMDNTHTFSDEELAKIFYDLMGFGLLPSNSEDLILERLQRHQQHYPQYLSLITLGDRLDRFYSTYCQTQWMNTDIPQQAYHRLQRLGNPLTLMQVDAAVGVNVFLLLAAIARLTQTPFYPCGIGDRVNPTFNSSYPVFGHYLPFNPHQLLTLAGRASTLAPFTFWQRLNRDLQGLHLPWVNLQQAILPESHLQNTHLEGAILIGTQLRSAQLQGANLTGADLSAADLSAADLSGANLSLANLTGANLQGVRFEGTQLENACLDQAIVDQQHQSWIQSQGVFWTWEQYCTYQEASWTEGQNQLGQTVNPAAPQSPLFPFIEVADDETVSLDSEAYRQLQEQAYEDTDNAGGNSQNMPTIAYRSEEPSPSLGWEDSPGEAVETLVYRTCDWETPSSADQEELAADDEDEGIDTIVYHPPV